MFKKVMKPLMGGLCAAALITTLFVPVTAKPKNLSKSAKVGDVVYFGSYEQDGNRKNGKEKIEWQVLSKKGNQVLLFSKNVLDVQPYHKSGASVTWEKSDLRKWLNKEFLKEAFSSGESKKIQTVKIENKDNKEYGIKGGGKTSDKVFLLSIDEAKKYFKTDEQRIGEITKYGIKRMAKVMKSSETFLMEEWFFMNNHTWYWLRSPGGDSNCAADVIYDGRIEERGILVNSVHGGIRPAVRVQLR